LDEEQFVLVSGMEVNINCFVLLLLLPEEAEMEFKKNDIGIMAEQPNAFLEKAEKAVEKSEISFSLFLLFLFIYSLPTVTVIIYFLFFLAQVCNVWTVENGVKNQVPYRRLKLFFF
jgi:hypothetical protein